MKNRLKNQLKNKPGFYRQLSYKISSAKGITIETNPQPYLAVVEKIGQASLGQVSDEELRARAQAIKQQALAGVPLAELLPGAYAVIAEVCSRVLDLRPYAVQLAAAIALHQGKLVQMQTGEGKTLAIVFPACLNALTGQGVHIMTANDYLAARDAAWMGPVFAFFGLQTGCIQQQTPPALRRQAYQADLTYLTAKEGGYDFLRDQLQYTPAGIVHRPLHMAIVDEADFILIDEARIPLVIAGRAPGTEVDACFINGIVLQLKRDRDFRVNKNGRSLFLTDAGQHKVQALAGCGGMHEAEALPVFAAVNAALHAHHLLHRDVDYIVRNGKIELVDEFTGRIAEQRRWPHGIQTALEAREGLPLQPEGRIYGSITVRHFTGLYPRLAALTATAVPAAAEFKKSYGLTTVIIPPNKPVIRIDAADRVYTSCKAKLRAIIEEISKSHATGRPVLVGTTSVEESEALANRLLSQGIRCRVLNAKNDQQEALLVADAGKPGAVTISTNMAGRGTDIKLGGEAETARPLLRELGGLYVIGTNRHESVRIDNQLRGRAGRQGDPGESCFFISLEDELIRRYSILEFIPREYLNGSREGPVADRRVAREIARAQEIIEAQHFTMRTILGRYTELAEKQRRYLQQIRAEALQSRFIPDEIRAGCTAQFTCLTAQMEADEVRDALLKIYLAQIDRFWCDHLELIEDIREGIYLQCYGSQDPLLEFIRMTSEAFANCLEQITQHTILSFNALQVTDGRIELAEPGLEGPASTWTYQINDKPLPGFRLALFDRRNPGFAALAALPMLLFSPVAALARLVRLICNKIGQRKRPDTQKAQPEAAEEVSQRDNG